MTESRSASSDEIVFDQLKLNAKNKKHYYINTWVNVWEKWQMKENSTPTGGVRARRSRKKVTNVMLHEVLIKNGLELVYQPEGLNSMLPGVCKTLTNI